MQITPRVMLGILKCAINDSVVLHFAKGLQNRMASREECSWIQLKPTVKTIH